MRGNSSDAVEIRPAEVKKTAGSPERNERLRQSMRMQEGFLDLACRAPLVRVHALEQEPIFWFTMDRIYGRHASESVGVELVYLVQRMIRAAAPTALARPVWTKKLEELTAAIHRAPFAAELRPLWLEAERLLRDALLEIQTLPCGPYHGDLNLTNAMEDLHGTVVVFDFCPSFLDSPVLDAANLLQDFRYGWVQEFVDIPTATLRSCEARWREAFQHELWYDHIPTLTLLKLVRMFPYCRDAQVLHFLRRAVPACIRSM